MEFARYLQDTQTPEWRKAYIGYRRLQAGLETIREAHADAMGSFVDFDLGLIHASIPNPQEKYDESEEVHPFQGRETSTYLASHWVSEADSETSGTANLGSCWSSVPLRQITSEQKRASFKLTLPGIPSHVKESENEPLSQTPHAPFFPLFQDSGCSVGSPLYRMFSDLPTYHIKFFDMLDAELAKVELFYAEREEEMYERAKILREQFDQLEVHHQIFQESSRAPLKYWDGIPILSFGREKYALDPGRYQSAQKRIREAIEEHYRCLEVLNNYRLLNLTGFREVLNAYAQVTHVSVLDVYMKEKVEPSAFGSGALVTTMVKETEYLFAKHFECGNRKKAISYLRASPISKTYYFIVLRSGLWFGLALPAIAGGSYLSFQESTRSSLPSWNILLYVYSILVVPVLLALLIGFNLLIWTRKRVNYAFILQLNARSKLDYRAYYELPCFLLCTLAYAFWFSLAQIGNPTLWPLIWLVLTIVIMFNPVGSLMQGRARWWTIKSMANLWACALRCVKFADVWLGDQMCSLVYSVSNLYFLGCFYTRFASGGFPSFVSSAYDLHTYEAWSTCNLSGNLLWHSLLGMLPFMIRFLQCLRQYHDSKVPSHLVNAGKYAMGMIQYFCYCYWRYQAGPRTGPSYILMCVTATINSIYACTWDFIMDWAMFKPYARYPFLRPELVYKSQIPWYYFALLSNLLIRFAWVTYVYGDEVHFDQHAFIAALLEVLRRVQWNLYRLENRHLDNMRQYRITRDLPLPYGVDTHAHADRKLMV